MDLPFGVPFENLASPDAFSVARAIAESFAVPQLSAGVGTLLTAGNPDDVPFMQKAHVRDHAVICEYGTTRVLMKVKARGKRSELERTKANNGDVLTHHGLLHKDFLRQAALHRLYHLRWAFAFSQLLDLRALAAVP